MPGFVLFFAFIPIIVVMSIVISLDKEDESMKETHVFNPGDIGFVNTPEGLDECRIEGIWPDCDPDHIMYQVQSLISSESYGAYAEKIFTIRENSIEARQSRLVMANLTG